MFHLRCNTPVIYTFKCAGCTGKSSSICMTARNNNHEGAFVKLPYVLQSIKFQNVRFCLSIYICGRCAHDLSLELYILHEGTYIRLAQSQFQPYFKLHSRFLRFRKFRLVISSTRGVMFNSFTHCLHFVGRWQTVQIQIRRHITKVALDQVIRCCSLEI